MNQHLKTWMKELNKKIVIVFSGKNQEMHFKDIIPNVYGYLYGLKVTQIKNIKIILFVENNQ